MELMKEVEDLKAKKRIAEVGKDTKSCWFCNVIGLSSVPCVSSCSLFNDVKVQWSCGYYLRILTWKKDSGLSP